MFDKPAFWQEPFWGSKRVDCLIDTHNTEALNKESQYIKLFKRHNSKAFQLKDNELLIQSQLFSSSRATLLPVVHIWAVISEEQLVNELKQPWGFDSHNSGRIGSWQQKLKLFYEVTNW